MGYMNLIIYCLQLAASQRTQGLMSKNSVRGFPLVPNRYPPNGCPILRSVASSGLATNAPVRIRLTL